MDNKIMDKDYTSPFCKEGTTIVFKNNNYRDVRDMVIMPNLTFNGYKNLIDNISDLDENKVSEQASIFLDVNTDNYTHNMVYTLGDKFKFMGPYTNNMPDGKGDVMGIRNLKPKVQDNRDTKQKVAFFNSLLGLGNPVNVTLYHSGFNITLKPMSVSDFTALEQTLYSEVTEVGKRTIGLLVSADKMHTIKILFETIKKYIIGHTLSIGEDDDILNYISILDVDAILAGVLHASNGKKLNIHRSCTSTNSIDKESGKLTCDAVIDADIDISKTLVVNRDMISDEMLKILSLRGHTVTTDQLDLYKSELLSMLVSKGRIEDSYSFDNLKLRFEIPTIAEYINRSEFYIKKFMSVVEQVVQSNNDIEDSFVRNVLESRIKLAQYVPLISSMELETDTMVEVMNDNNGIVEILINLSRNNKNVEDIRNTLYTFYNNSHISLVCIPNYTCPKCNGDQTDVSEVPDYEDNYIPISMLSFFTYLGIVKN